MSPITFFRRLKNISQKQLAEGIGCSQATVSRYDRGANIPDLAFFARFVHYLDLTDREVREVLKYFCEMEHHTFKPHDKGRIIERKNFFIE